MFQIVGEFPNWGVDMRFTKCMSSFPLEVSNKTNISSIKVSYVKDEHIDILVVINEVINN